MRAAAFLGVYWALTASGYGQEPSAAPQPGPRVLLRTKLVEISKTRLERRGLQLSYRGVTCIAAEQSGNSTASPVAFLGEPHGLCGWIPTTVVAVDVQTFPEILESLERDKLARVLSEPTLVTVSGQAASCRVGGQVPLVFQRPDGKVETTYKDYGTNAEFLPIVLDGGRIRLQLRFEVTEVDRTQTVEVAGHANPVLRSRHVDTGVEIRSGQTVLIHWLTRARAPEGPASHAATPAPSTQPAEEFDLVLLATPEILPAGVPAADPVSPLGGGTLRRVQPVAVGG